MYNPLVLKLLFFLLEMKCIMVIMCVDEFSCPLGCWNLLKDQILRHVWGNKYFFTSILKVYLLDLWCLATSHERTWIVFIVSQCLLMLSGAVAYSETTLHSFFHSVNCVFSIASYFSLQAFCFAVTNKYIGKPAKSEPE